MLVSQQLKVKRCSQSVLYDRRGESQRPHKLVGFNAQPAAAIAALHTKLYGWDAVTETFTGLNVQYSVINLTPCTELTVLTR